MDHAKRAKAKAAMMGDGPSGGGDEGWTEERHASFLNRMEESFVRTMLRLDAGGSTAATARPSLTLDRFLPDSATESSRDSHQSSSRPPAPLMDPGTQNLAARNHRIIKKRILPQREYNPMQDQVVPQSERTEDDKAK